MESYTVIAAVIACFVGSVLGAVDANNGWAFPGREGPSSDTPWQVGSFQPLEWYTTLSDYNITLWQMDPPSKVGVVWETSNGNGAGSKKTFSWQVQTMNADPDVSPRYMLWGGEEINKTSSSGFTSYTFNITDKAVESSTPASGNSRITASTTSSNSETASPTGPATTDVASSTASSSPASANVNLPNDPSGNSADSEPNKDSISKLGLGVGIGVGVPIAIALSIFLGWFIIRRRRNKRASLPSWVQNDHDTSPIEELKPPIYETTTEVPAWHARGPVELGTDRSTGMSELGG